MQPRQQPVHDHSPIHSDLQYNNMISNWLLLRHIFQLNCNKYVLHRQKSLNVYWAIEYSNQSIILLDYIMCTVYIYMYICDSMFVYTYMYIILLDLLKNL